MNIFRQLKRYLIYRLKRKIHIDKNFLNENPSLDKLFRFYNCDKGSSFITEKDRKDRYVRGHNYAIFYEKHFNRFKYKRINILEIGVYSGGSSASFATYFSNSTIFCLDVNLTNFKYYSKKFKVFGLDISNRVMIENFLQKNNIHNKQDFFDIIIDDCTHRLSDQITSLFFFFNYLKHSGIYVIEEFRFPNLYPHLNDCKKENKIDEILNSIKNKKNFKSNLIKKEAISDMIKKVRKITTYKGHHHHSDIAFIEKK